MSAFRTDLNGVPMVFRKELWCQSETLVRTPCYVHERRTRRDLGKKFVGWNLVRRSAPVADEIVYECHLLHNANFANDFSYQLAAASDDNLGVV